MTAVGTLTGGVINIPDTAVDDTVTITVIVDNGMASLLSQKWMVLDIVSGRIDVGSYTALYTSPFLDISGFNTDSAGILTFARFAVIPSVEGNADVVDNYGSSFNGGLFTTAVQDTFRRQSQFGFDTANASLWNVAFVSVPEPGTFVLLIAGLVGLCVVRCKRNA